MTKQKNGVAAMATILLISLFQMSHLAIAPAIDRIATQIFPERTFQTIQTVTSLPNIISCIVGVLSALFIARGWVSKRISVLLGLSLIGIVGAASLVLHNAFWQLCLLNALVGAGMGLYIPSAQSIMFDNFDEKARQFISGLQSSFINIGGILLSVFGGLLTAVVWYGGHLILLSALPAAVAAFIFIPRDKSIQAPGTKKSKATKLPVDVFYYTALILLFVILYFVAAYNLATHLASGGIDDPAAAGVATAIMMAGGVVSGFVFPKLSPKLGENLLTTGFMLMFIGYTILNLFAATLTGACAGMFFCGAALSIYVPRCMFDVANITDPSNSATASMLIASVAPGIGGFISPVIMTNLTIALGGESTRFRYQFAGFVSLALALLIFLNNTRRKKKLHNLEVK